MTSTPSYHSGSAPPAPVSHRMVAGVIDLVGGGAIFAGLGLLLGMAFSRRLVAWAVAALIVVALRELVLAATGWSPGGRIMGVRLVDANTGGAPTTRLFLHADVLFLALVPTAGLGAIVLMRAAAADPRGQGQHDRLAGIMAVTVRPNPGRPGRPGRSGRSETSPERTPRTAKTARPAGTDAVRPPVPGPLAPPSGLPAPEAYGHGDRDGSGHAGPADRFGPPAQLVPPGPAQSGPPGGPGPQAPGVPGTQEVPGTPGAPGTPGIQGVPHESATPAGPPPGAPVPDGAGFDPGNVFPPAGPLPEASEAPEERPHRGLLHHRTKKSKRQAQPGPQHMAPRPQAAERRTPVADWVFPEDPFFYAPGSDTADIGNTVDTSAMIAMPPNSDRAIIDSIPWSSVPTRLDPPTQDDAPLTDVAGGDSDPVGSTDSARSAGSSAHLAESVGSAGSAGPAGPTGPLGSAGSPSAPPPSNPEVVSPAAPSPSFRSSAPEEAAIVSPTPGPMTHPSEAEDPWVAASIQAAASPTIGSAAAPMTSASSAAPTSPASPTSSAASPSGARGRHRQTEDPRAARLVPLIGGVPVELNTPIVVGRDPDNISEYSDAVCVSLRDVNRSISKTHAALAPVPGGLWITDLHSTNGTRIEEEAGEVTRAEPGVPVPVPTGSTIVLGSAAYRVED